MCTTTVSSTTANLCGGESASWLQLVHVCACMHAYVFVAVCVVIRMCTREGVVCVCVYSYVYVSEGLVLSNIICRFGETDDAKPA